MAGDRIGKLSGPMLREAYMQALVSGAADVDLHLQVVDALSVVLDKVCELRGGRHLVVEEIGDELDEMRELAVLVTEAEEERDDAMKDAAGERERRLDLEKDHDADTRAREALMVDIREEKHAMAKRVSELEVGGVFEGMVSGEEHQRMLEEIRKLLGQRDAELGTALLKVDRLQAEVQALEERLRLTAAARPTVQRTPPAIVAHPFLKCLGGKRKLVPDLLARVPTEFGAYHEPFVGGGALFLALRTAGRIRVAHLSDANLFLADAWAAVMTDLPGLVASLSAMPFEKAFYETQRAREPSTMTPTERAAWFLYLNKSCFNGVWRVNKSGRFNVPMGNYKNPTICDEQNLRAVSAALSGEIVIRREDFAKVLVRAKAGDLVYFDPPYLPISATSNFVGYTADGFGPNDHERLRDCALALKERGVHVMLSNSDAPYIRELYTTGFVVEAVGAPRSVNSAGSKRGDVRELIIT